MKRYILSAAALASLHLATPVMAAEAPIQLSLGASLRQFFAVTDQDQATGENLNATSMSNLARVSVSGKGDLADGWRASAFVRFEAATRKTEGVDEAYIDLSNARYGTFRAGEKEGFNASFIGEPVPEAFLTTDERVVGTNELAVRSRTGISISDAFTFKRFATDVLSVQYRSPELNVGSSSLQGAVSYHPRLDTVPGAVDRTNAPSNAIDVSGAYTLRFTDGTLKVAGGYIHVDSRTAPGGNDGLSAFNTQVQLKYRQFTVAGTYMDVNPANGLKQNLWAIGGMYAAAPWKFSADFSHFNRKAALTGPREAVDLLKGQVAYRIWHGIDLGLVGFYSSQRDATAARRTWNAVGGIVGIKVEI